MQRLTQLQTTWPLPVTELKPALDLALAALRADMGVVLLHDDDTDSLVPVLGAGLSGAQCADLGASHGDVDPFMTALAEHRRILLHDPWSTNDGVSALARRLGFRALDIHPLCGAAGEGLGAIVVMFRKHRGPNDRSLPLVESCVQLAVSAVLHARLHVAAERAAREARESVRDRAELVARMSHELRTPLQSIIGYIDLMGLDGAEPLTATQRHMLGRVRASEQMLMNAINDLIVFSQLGAGRVGYQLAPVLAREVMGVAQEVLTPLANDRGVHLDWRTCSSDTVVLADREKLTQVLVNLVANGVKFTERDGTVSLECIGDREVVKFVIRDTGGGIPADRLEDIFKPFVRLDGAPSARAEGSGLGLAISRDFAIGMGGKLTAQSTLGRGSVFTLTLPRAAPKPEVMLSLLGAEKRRAS